MKWITHYRTPRRLRRFHRFHWYVVALVSGLGLLPSCTSHRPPPTTPTSEPAPSVPTPQAPAAGSASSAVTLEEYKREIARLISAKAGNEVYTTQPQALLRAVIVVNFDLLADGNVRNVRIQRSPGDRQLEQRALTSVQRATPLPRPASGVMRGRSSIEVSETWLFNSDGRFQLRSIALPQKETNF